MIASLPMYDRPETAAAQDRLWAAIRAAAPDCDLPEHLTRTGDPWELWRSPLLAFSQTCGLPFRRNLHRRVHLVATPIHALDTPPGHYYSVIVARADDPRTSLAEFRDARLAVNDMRSQSGWAAPQVMASNEGFVFTDLLTSGSHAESVRAVAMRAADLAAIDAVSWSFIAKWDDAANELKVIEHTPPTPALPWITSQADLVEPLFDAVSTAIEAVSEDDRDRLCLRGATRIAARDYLAVPDPAQATRLHSRPRPA